jgi:hypothetical protein
MLRRQLGDTPESLAVVIVVGYRVAMSRIVRLALPLLLALYGPVLAVGANPCRGDVTRLCAGVTPGEGRIRDCIRVHAAELSPPCKAWLEAARRSTPGRQLDAQTIGACRGDVDRLCHGIPSGGGRWRRCLEDHSAALSEGCRATMGPSASPGAAAK